MSNIVFICIFLCFQYIIVYGFNTYNEKNILYYAYEHTSNANNVYINNEHTSNANDVYINNFVKIHLLIFLFVRNL